MAMQWPNLLMVTCRPEGKSSHASISARIVLSAYIFMSSNLTKTNEIFKERLNQKNKGTLFILIRGTI